VLSSLVLVPEMDSRRVALGSGSPGQTPSGLPGTAFANLVGKARADLYVVLDEVAGVTPANLDKCSAERTIAVVNTDLFPTGQQVRDVHHSVDVAAMRSEIAQHTRSVVDVPARRIAETLLGDYMMTNLVVLGAAFQAGSLPLSSTSIERAISLNGVGVAANTLAFRLGRLWVQDPDRVERLLAPRTLDADEERSKRQAALSPRNAHRFVALNERIDEAGLSPEARRLLAVRVAELIDYQSAAWAERYVDRVLDAARIVTERVADRPDLVEAVAGNLYKLMAYKDEYETARLFLKPAWRAQIASTFEQPVKVSLNLLPPAARILGRKRKIRVGPWFVPVLHVLRAARRLRGTPFDPFAVQRSRREERELIAWYEQLLDRAFAALRSANVQTVLSIVELPDLIRGYEGVKAASLPPVRAHADELVARLDRVTLSLVASVRQIG
jgi:indolepyruvate ferredoxin oxidoreductase